MVSLAEQGKLLESRSWFVVNFKVINRITFLKIVLLFKSFRIYKKKLFYYVNYFYQSFEFWDIP